MKYFVDIPGPILGLFEKNNVKIKKLLYCARADLDDDGNYIDCYLCFDKNNLYIIKCLLPPDADLDMPHEFFSYQIKKIDEAEISRDMYSARFYLKTGGKNTYICRFSIGYCDMFEKFKERLVKTKKSEEIDDKPLDEKKVFCDKCGLRYPDQNRPVCPNCLNKMTVLKRMLKMYGEFKVQAFAFGICIVITTVLGLIAPLFSTKFLYDQVLDISGSYYGNIVLAVMLIVGTQISAMIVGVVYTVLNAFSAPKMLHNLRVKLFSAMQPLSLSFFTSKQTGNLMTRITNDTDYIYGFFIDIVPQVVINIIKIAGIIGVLFVLSPSISLFIGLVLVVFGISIYKFFRVQRRIWRKYFASMSRNQAYVSDVLNGQRVVKAFSKEFDETERYNSQTEDLYTQNLAAYDRLASYMPKVKGIINMVFAAVFMVGGLLIIYGHMTLGSLVAFMAYAGMVFGPVDYMTWFVDWWSSCVNAASRMFEILDASPTVVEKENPVVKETLDGNIELKNVSFEYEIGRPILKHIDMKINSGEMFGIVGKTGAGKSTIINLISRLYDVKNGELIIDGVNVKDYSFETLRSNIGVVSQETYLFIGTLTDNIGYGAKNYTMHDIITAAKSAFAHDFITKLTDGYDALVGSGGISLSGGEKQRISIARAILQAPSILILDEATSAMDTQTERRIQHAIEKLRKGRTVIAIAHRLSTLRDADKLAVIEGGELKELGTHSELINKRGVYYNLHKLQSDSLKFIEMGDDGMSGSVTSLYSLDDISEIRYLNRDNAVFRADESGFLSAVIDGVAFENLTLYRLLPYSDSFGYISVWGKVPVEKDEENKNNSKNNNKKEEKEDREIGIIRSIDEDFSENQAEIIKSELEFRYYCPVTSTVTSVWERMSYVFIKAVFNGKEKEICVNEPTKNMRVSKNFEHSILITDVEGNRYLLKEINLMPKQLRQKIETFVYM